MDWLIDLVGLLVVTKVITSVFGWLFKTCVARDGSREKAGRELDIKS